MSFGNDKILSLLYTAILNTRPPSCINTFVLMKYTLRLSVACQTSVGRVVGGGGQGGLCFAASVYLRIDTGDQKRLC